MTDVVITQEVILSYFVSQQEYKQARLLKTKIENGEEYCYPILCDAIQKVLNSPKDDPEYVPMKKLLAVRLGKEMMDIHQRKLADLFSREVLPHYRDIALFKFDDQDPDRGKTYFSQSPDKLLAQIGNSFLRMTLESIKVWAQWYPLDQLGNPTPYLLLYGDLLYKGVQFPEYQYFKQDKFTQHISPDYERALQSVQSKQIPDQDALQQSSYRRQSNQKVEQSNSISQPLQSQSQPLYSQSQNLSSKINLNLNQQFQPQQHIDVSIQNSQPMSIRSQKRAAENEQYQKPSFDQSLLDQSTPYNDVHIQPPKHLHPQHHHQVASQILPQSDIAQNALNSDTSQNQIKYKQSFAEPQQQFQQYQQEEQFVQAVPRSQQYSNQVNQNDVQSRAQDSQFNQSQLTPTINQHSIIHQINPQPQPQPQFNVLNQSRTPQGDNFNNSMLNNSQLNMTKLRKDAIVIVRAFCDSRNQIILICQQNFSTKPAPIDQLNRVKVDLIKYNDDIENLINELINLNEDDTVGQLLLDQEFMQEYQQDMVDLQSGKLSWGAFRKKYIQGPDLEDQHKHELELLKQQHQRQELERAEQEKQYKQQAEREFQSKLQQELLKHQGQREGDRYLSDQREKEYQDRLRQEQLRAEQERNEREQFKLLNDQREKEYQERLRQEQMVAEKERQERERIRLLNEQKEREYLEKIQQEQIKAEERIKLIHDQKEREYQEKLQQERYKAELEKLDKENIRQLNEHKERDYKERLYLEQQRAEQERQDKEKIRLLTLEREKEYQDRLLQEQLRAEKERQAKEQLERLNDQREKDYQEMLRQEKVRAEQERIAKEQARIEKERIEKELQERLERERLQKERFLQEHMDRLDAERKERDRLQLEMLNRGRQDQEETKKLHQQLAEKIAKEEEYLRDRQRKEKLEQELRERDEFERQRQEKIRQQQEEWQKQHLDHMTEKERLNYEKQMALQREQEERQRRQALEEEYQRTRQDREELERQFKSFLTEKERMEFDRQEAQRQVQIEKEKRENLEKELLENQQRLQIVESQIKQQYDRKHQLHQYEQMTLKNQYNLMVEQRKKDMAALEEQKRRLEIEKNLIEIERMKLEEYENQKRTQQQQQEQQESYIQLRQTQQLNNQKEQNYKNIFNNKFGTKHKGQFIPIKNQGDSFINQDGGVILTPREQKQKQSFFQDNQYLSSHIEDLRKELSYKDRTLDQLNKNQVELITQLMHEKASVESLEAEKAKLIQQNEKEILSLQHQAESNQFVLQTTIDGLQDQLKIKDEFFAQSLKEQEELKIKFYELEQKYREVQAQNQEFNEMFGNHQLQRDQSTLNGEYIRNFNDEKVKMMQQEIDELKNTLGQKDKHIEQYQVDKQHLVSQINLLSTQIQSHQDTYQMLSHQHETLKKTHQDKLQQHQVFRSNLEASHQDQIIQLQKQFQEKEFAHDEEKQQLKEQIDQLKHSIDMYNHEINQHKFMKEQLQHEVLNHQQKLFTKTRENDQIRAQVNTTNSVPQHKNLFVDLEESKARIKELEDIVNENQVKIQRLTQDNANLQKRQNQQREEFNQNTVDLKRQLLKAQNQCEQLQGELTHQEEMLKQTALERSDVQSQLTTLRTLADSQQQQIVRFMQQLTKQKENTGDEQMRSLMNQVQILQETNAQDRAKYQEEVRQIQTTKDETIQQLQREIQFLLGQQQVNESQIRELQEYIQDQEKEFKELDQNYQQSIDELQKRDMEIHQLQMQLEQQIRFRKSQQGSEISRAPPSQVSQGKQSLSAVVSRKNMMQRK